MIDRLPVQTPALLGERPQPCPRDTPSAPGSDFAGWLAREGGDSRVPTPENPGAPEPMPPRGPGDATADWIVREIVLRSAHGIASSAADTLDFSTMPWRLRANRGLSYVTTRLGHIDPLPNAALPGASAPGAGAAPAAFAPPFAAASGLATINAPVGTPTGHAATTARTTSAAPADAARQADPVRLAALLWPHRLVRAQAGDDGVTVWVRDYRVGPDGHARLVEQLRCDARQDGLPIRRIVLNGHELWRSPSDHGFATS